MKQTIFISVFLTTSVFVSAQVGIAGAYKSLTANGWYDYIRTNSGTDVGSIGGYAVSLDYWFRLKKKRVEFTPELSFENYSKTLAGTEYEHQILGFYFNTNLYPFDFASDCDCPVWSKDGNLFTKGFFLQLSPGVWQLSNTIHSDVMVEDEAYSWVIGAGAGLDIGLSEFLTVTPLVRFYHSPDNTWSNLPDVKGEPVSVDSAVNQFYAGIRLGVRWKQDKRPGRR